jgi:hypothetical protein
MFLDWIGMGRVLWEIIRPFDFLLQSFLINSFRIKEGFYAAEREDWPLRSGISLTNPIQAGAFPARQSSLLPLLRDSGSGTAIGRI